MPWLPDFKAIRAGNRAQSKKRTSVRAQKARDIRTETTKSAARGISAKTAAKGAASGAKLVKAKVYRQAGQITKAPVVGARSGFNSITPKSASSALTYNNSGTRTAPSGDYDAMYPMPKTASMVVKRAKPVAKAAPVKMKMSVIAREVPRETFAQRSAKLQQSLAKKRMIAASNKG